MDIQVVFVTVNRRGQPQRGVGHQVELHERRPAHAVHDQQRLGAPRGLQALDDRPHQVCRQRVGRAQRFAPPARVVTLARSEPAPGSLMPMQKKASARQMRGR